MRADPADLCPERCCSRSGISACSGRAGPDRNMLLGLATVRVGKEGAAATAEALVVPPQAGSPGGYQVVGTP